MHNEFDLVNWCWHISSEAHYLRLKHRVWVKMLTGAQRGVTGHCKHILGYSSEQMTEHGVYIELHRL